MLTTYKGCLKGGWRKIHTAIEHTVEEGRKFLRIALAYLVKVLWQCIAISKKHPKHTATARGLKANTRLFRQLFKIISQVNDFFA